MTGDWDEPLDALRWHWGEAYVINRLGLGRWTAERRDTHETLRDQTPLGLRDKIISDYSARKVPRHPNGHLPSEPGPARGYRTAPGGQDWPAVVPPSLAATVRRVDVSPQLRTRSATLERCPLQAQPWDR